MRRAMTAGPPGRNGRRGFRRPVLWVGLAVAIGAVATIAASPAFADAEEGSIREAGTANTVADSYIVALKPSATAVEGSAGKLASRYGGKVNHIYTDAVHGFSVKMTEAKAKHLAANPAVAVVQRDGIYTISDTQKNPPSPGLDRIDQAGLPLDHSYTYPNTASNVHAYIIDTGIRLDHTTFGGRATKGIDAVGGGVDDCAGHGTHVAGTVGGSQYGVAKGVQLVAVRVLDCQGSGRTSDVVAGIDWVTKHAIKPAVANMSLGGGIDSMLDSAVENSISSGVTYSIAAGNEATNACSSSPSRVPAAITVGAIDVDDSQASFSNFGNCVDIFAPGVGITSSYNTSPTATATMKGTSMATPHVTGAAALVLAANSNLTPAQVRDTLVNQATTGKITNLGKGSPNKLLFVGAGGTPPSQTPAPGSPPAPSACSGTNDTELAVPDAGAAVASSIRISGCNRKASAESKVEVHISHPYRGDLIIDLVAPDGTAYRLKNSNRADGADNVDATVPVNLSSETADGTWKLKVQDALADDSGTLTTWTLTV